MKSKNNVLLLLFLILLISYRLLICINYTPEISVGETNNIWNALSVANGKPLYSNPEDTPFEIFQYTPLSQLPIITAAALFNPNSDKYAYYVMVTGRIVSLLLNIFTFCFVFILLKNILNVSKTLSLTAAITAFGLLTHLAFAVRPDALSLFLTIVSVYLFSKAYFQNNFYYYIYSGFVFAFSFFAKQDSFSIITALGIYLMINKNWKALIGLVFSFVISFILLLFVFKLIFGKFLLLSVVGGLSLGYSINQAQEVFQHFLSFYNIIFYLGIAGCVAIARKIVYDGRSLFLLILSVVSFLIAVATTFKLGSWMNYYTPFVIYTILLIYYVVDHLVKKSNRKSIETIVVFSTVIYVSAFVYLQVFHYTVPFVKYSQSKAEYSSTNESFKDFKKDAGTHNYVIFSFDKRIKLLLFKNTIFPNTEYYHVSRFSFEGYKKLNSSKKITHIIKNTNIGDSQFSTLDYYHIPLSEFKEKTNVLNYIIYEHER